MTLPSSINLINPQTRQRFPAAPDKSVVLSSSQAGWCQDLILEVHRLMPMELPEHYLEGHRLIINLGGAVRFGWRSDGRTNEAVFPPGGLCLQSDGETNAPYWQDEMTVAAVAVSPEFITTLLEDRAPAAIDTFVERRCVFDTVSYDFAKALSSELATPSEPLYAETLSIAFVLHLLAAHARSTEKPSIPRGKLSSAQLKNVCEVARLQLAPNLSLNQLAQAANVSPFHFARLFKNTTGLAPHQFILRLRLERAKRLIAADQLSLTEIALAVGFFDQAHFTNVFRRSFGLTPKAFAKAL